jgi:hypothetical protein
VNEYVKLSSTRWSLRREKRSVSRLSAVIHQ